MVMVMMADNRDEAEIVQDEESGEVEPGAPEWIGYPVVQIIIIPRRWIVRNDRWTFIVVIIVDYRSIRLSLIFSIPAGAARNNRQTELGCEALEGFQSFILSHGQLFGIGRGNHGVLQLSKDNRCHRIIRNPPIPRRDTDG